MRKCCVIYCFIVRTVLLIHGGKVTEGSPSLRFRLRLDAALEYYRQKEAAEDVIFLVSGRWSRVTDNFLMTEAEVGKQYILQRLPEATVVKEDVSVELLGNYAFSAPLIASLNPGQVIIFTSEILEARVSYLAKRIFANKFTYRFHFLEDEMSHNSILKDKETQAIGLLKKLSADITDGDDAAFREKLLYNTPYYFKGIINDQAFFDTYWEGGFGNYIHGITVRNNS